MAAALHCAWPRLHAVHVEPFRQWAGCLYVRWIIIGHWVARLCKMAEKSSLLRSTVSSMTIKSNKNFVNRHSISRDAHSLFRRRTWSALHTAWVYSKAA